MTNIRINPECEIGKLSVIELIKQINAKLPKYQQFVGEVRNTSITLIYKQVNKFYSQENIKQFMKIFVAKKGGLNKLSKVDEKKLYTFISER
jgi:hypothetical protein